MTVSNRQLPTLNLELKNINSDLETKLSVLEANLQVVKAANQKHQRLISQNRRLRLLIRLSCQKSFHIATAPILQWLERCGFKSKTEKTEE